MHLRVLAETEPIRFDTDSDSKPVAKGGRPSMSRWADFLGCHDGWDVQMADAVQAYIQATLRGTPRDGACYVHV